jgi:hypothetical protein
MSEDKEDKKVKSLTNDSPESIVYQAFMEKLRKAGEEFLEATPENKDTPFDGDPFHAIIYYAIPKLDFEVARVLIPYFFEELILSMPAMTGKELLTKYLGVLLANQPKEKRDEAMQEIIAAIYAEMATKDAENSILIPDEGSPTKH